MARGESIDRGALTGAINAWQEKGLTQTAALGELRGAGLGIRDSVFRQVWREIQGVRMNAARIADLPGQEVVPDVLHTEWRAGTAGKYAYQVNMMVRDLGSTTSDPFPYMIISDNPMTPNDILIAVSDQMNQFVEEGASGEGQEIHGGMLVGAYVMTGRPQ